MWSIQPDFVFVPFPIDPASLHSKWMLNHNVQCAESFGMLGCICIDMYHNPMRNKIKACMHTNKKARKHFVLITGLKNVSFRVRWNVQIDWVIESWNGRKPMFRLQEPTMSHQPHCDSKRAMMCYCSYCYLCYCCCCCCCWRRRCHRPGLPCSTVVDVDVDHLWPDNEPDQSVEVWKILLRSAWPSAPSRVQGCRTPECIQSHGPVLGMACREQNKNRLNCCHQPNCLWGQVFTSGKFLRLVE